MENELKKVVLVGCGRKQDPGFHKAKDLYISRYFKLKWEYAETFKSEIWILSDKHHLLYPENFIKNYDTDNANDKEWAKEVIDDIKALWDVNKTEFIILAGKKYTKNIIGSLPYYKLPLEGVQGVGKQNDLLTALINEQDIDE